MNKSIENSTNFKQPTPIKDEYLNEEPKKKILEISSSGISIKRDLIKCTQERTESSDDEIYSKINLQNVNLKSLDYLLDDNEEKKNENEMLNKINFVMSSYEKIFSEFIKEKCEINMKEIETIKGKIILNKMNKENELMKGEYIKKNETKTKEMNVFEKYLKMADESLKRNNIALNNLESKIPKLIKLSEEKNNQKNELKNNRIEKSNLYISFLNEFEELEKEEKKLDIKLKNSVNQIEKYKKETEEANKQIDEMKNEIIILRPFFKRLLLLRNGNNNDFKIEITRNREKILFDEKEIKFDLIISVINNLIEFEENLQDENQFIFNKFYSLFQSLIIKFSTSDRNFMLLWLNNNLSFEKLNHFIIELINKIKQIIPELKFVVKVILKEMICSFPEGIDENSCNERIKNVNSNIFGFIYTLNKEIKGKNISFNIFNISYNYDDLKSILHIIEDKYQKKKKNINNPNNNIIKKVFGNKEKDKDKDKNPSIKPKDILIKEFLSLKPAQSIIINDINETDLMNQNVKEIIETLNKKY